MLASPGGLLAGRQLTVACFGGLRLAMSGWLAAGAATGVQGWLRLARTHDGLHATHSGLLVRSPARLSVSKAGFGWPGRTTACMPPTAAYW